MWRPEFDIDLIEASAWGTTVPAAASARVRDLADGEGVRRPVRRAESRVGRPAGEAGLRGGRPGRGRRGAGVSLADLTGLVEKCLLAELPDALPHVLDALSARAALDSDVTHLMAALPAMVRAQRYGDVRGTPAAGLAAIVDALLTRVCVGLGAAVTGLDDDAARDLLGHVDAVHAAVGLLDPGTDSHGASGGGGRAPVSSPGRIHPRTAGWARCAGCRAARTCTG
nr:hypothetical protein GCM10020093_037320 [Planobispora longispora]